MSGRTTIEAHDDATGGAAADLNVEKDLQARAAAHPATMQLGLNRSGRSTAGQGDTLTPRHS